MHRILVADDHAMMRTALAGMVALVWPDASVATATDFASAAALAPDRDLILCDLAMPDLPPIDGVRRVMAAAPDTPLIIVTGMDDDALLLALFEMNVAGFIPKTSDGQVIEAAVRLVAAGGRYLPPRVLALVGGRVAPTRIAAPLTERQRDVLRLVVQGSSNKEIARQLDLSPATIKAHVAALLDAMGAANRTEAAYMARVTGLVDGP